MATVTVTLGILTDENNKTCTLQYDYDDVALHITAARIINNTPRQCFASLTDNVNNRTYAHTFAANVTQSISIPTGANTRLRLIALPNGRLDGVEVQFGLV